MLAQRIAGLHQAPQLVVRPFTGLAGAVGVFEQLPGVVVRQLLLVAVGVLDRLEQPGGGVGKLGLVAQRVDRFDQVADIVVVAQPQAAFGIADLDQLVFVVVGVVHDGMVGADVLQAVAAFIVGVAVLAAVGVQVADHVLAGVAEQPLERSSACWMR
jgi:hypothetical protein